MAGSTSKSSHENDSQLCQARQLAKSTRNRAELTQYQRDLIDWANNIDRRYAWLVLCALFLMMAATLGPYRVYALIYAKVTHDGVYSREEASWAVAMILTVENVMGPLVSIISNQISYRNSMLIGGILTALGNFLAYFSDGLMMDILVIGIVQGIGYAFIFMPFMEVINNYFIRYRSLAFGIALCGGTASVFVMSPSFQWILDEYSWRTSYLAIGLICCLNIVMVSVLKPNPRPEVPVLELERADSKQEAPPKVETRISTIELEKSNNKIFGELHEIDLNDSTDDHQNAKYCSNGTHLSQGATQDISGQSGLGAPSSGVRTIVSILKVPGFHLIWYMEMLYFWIYTIYCLVLVDYGKDRGCSVEEAESLLHYQSVGEFIGRLGLAALVDMRMLSNKDTVILVLILLGALLIVITQATGILWLAVLTTSISAVASILYILINGLLVDFLGERRVTIGYGMASFLVGIMLIFRPQAVGFFRDNMGSYDPLMMSLAGACVLGALLCLFETFLSKGGCSYFGCKVKNKVAIRV